MNRLAFTVACLAGIAHTMKLNIAQESANEALAQAESYTTKGNKQKSKKTKHYGWKDFKLAQVASVEQPECNEAIQRLKTPAVNFYELYDGATSTDYSDELYPHGSNALYWANRGEANGSTNNLELYNGMTWARSKDLLTNHTLWGSKVSPTDVKQGQLNNCWVWGALQSLADHENRIESLFLNYKNELDQNGIYGMTIYSLGVPTTVVIDDWIPYIPDQTDSVNMPFGRISSDGAAWVAIAEKAFAKYHGNYQHMDDGSPATALKTLTGAPFEILKPSDVVQTDSSGNNDYSAVWDFVVRHDTANSLITFLSSTQVTNSRTQDNFVANHVYSILGTAELSNGVQLFKIRNPWSMELYTGPYRDADPIWDELTGANPSNPQETWKDQIPGFEQKEDGIMYIDMKTFEENVSKVYANFDTDGWHYSKFLRLDDNWGGLAGVDQACGAECTRHELTVENLSSEPQQVYISAYTWQYRPYPRQCQKWTRSTKNVLQVGSTIYHTYYGEASADAIMMDPGQSISVAVEYDWTEQTGLDADWSVVAWSDKGEVSITHDEGYASQDFPYIKPISDASQAAAAVEDYKQQLANYETQLQEHQSKKEAWDAFKAEQQAMAGSGLRALQGDAIDQMNTYGDETLAEINAKGCGWGDYTQTNNGSEYGAIFMFSNNCRSYYPTIKLVYNLTMKVEDWDALTPYSGNGAEWDLGTCINNADGTRMCQFRVGGAKIAGFILPQVSDKSSVQISGQSYVM